MKNPPLELLKFRSIPAVAAALRASREEIVQAWQVKILSSLPSPDKLTLEQLRNSIPDLLDQIADALDSSQARETAQLLRISPEHGKFRFHQKVNLNELLIEYHFLRSTIFDHLTSTLGRPLELVEVLEVNSAIDVAMRHAAVAFAEDQAMELRAEVASTSKYLSFLSHDIRGGLNGVVLMIEVLRREFATRPEFSDSFDDLDAMRRSILDTVSTMDRLLNAERLRRGKMPVKLSAVNLKTLLEDLTKSLHYQAEDRGIRLLVDVPHDCPLVSDRDLIAMIIQNLALNAIKYSPTGTKVILSASTSAANAGQICVRDQGPGIEPEKLNSLFAPFTRGETHGQAGSGLGLFIARQAADLLSATLRGESTPGQGTAFYLDLPAQSNT
jgi:signal transduction histidine kinase